MNPNSQIPLKITQLQEDPAPSTDGWMVYVNNGKTYKVQVNTILTAPISWLNITGGVATPDYIDFNTATPDAATTGRLVWDDGSGTLDLGLKGGNIALRIGQEEVQLCVNGGASTLTEGNVVQITGAQGNRIKVTRSQANQESTSVHTIGMVAETIAPNGEGFVTASGLIRKINTVTDSDGNTTTDGATIYLSPFTAGGWTVVKPSAPNHLVIIGFIVRRHATVGEIFVKVDNGYELDELHNVKITAPVAAGSLLIYDQTAGYWENATLTQGTGITITNADGSITVANDDRGSSQNIFKNVAVAGQSTIVADTNNDTLTVVAGTGVTLTTNASTDTLTITANINGGTF
jgi:hypothetical protein